MPFPNRSRGEFFRSLLRVLASAESYFFFIGGLFQNVPFRTTSVVLVCRIVKREGGALQSSGGGNRFILSLSDQASETNVAKGIQRLSS